MLDIDVGLDEISPTYLLYFALPLQPVILYFAQPQNAFHEAVLRGIFTCIEEKGSGIKGGSDTFLILGSLLEKIVADLFDSS